MTGKCESPVTVLVVDDDHWTTRGLAAALAVAPGLRVLGAVHSGEEAVESYRAEPADVVLMDINMGPGMTGVDATAQILALNPAARVLILTTTAPGPGVSRALEAGALAMVRKDGPESVLVGAIRAAARGDNPALLKGLARDIVVSGGSELSSPGVAPALTERELEVLHLICEGIGYQDIAERLVVSPNTVDTHVRRLREKLNASTLSQLVLRALQHRYIDL